MKIKHKVLGLIFVLALLVFASPAKATTIDDLWNEVQALKVQVAQLKNQLGAGVLGAETSQVSSALSADSYKVEVDPGVSAVLRSISTGDIKTLQSLLKGYYAGALDSKLGTQTKEAVYQYIKDKSVASVMPTPQLDVSYLSQFMPKDSSEAFSQESMDKIGASKFKDEAIKIASGIPVPSDISGVNLKSKSRGADVIYVNNSFGQCLEYYWGGDPATGGYGWVLTNVYNTPCGSFQALSNFGSYFVRTGSLAGVSASSIVYLDVISSLVIKNIAINNISALQQLLKDNGYYLGKVDGLIGSQTKVAVYDLLKAKVMISPIKAPWTDIYFEKLLPKNAGDSVTKSSLSKAGMDISKLQDSLTGEFTQEINYSYQSAKTANRYAAYGTTGTLPNGSQVCIVHVYHSNNGGWHINGAISGSCPSRGYETSGNFQPPRYQLFSGVAVN